MSFHPCALIPTYNHTKALETVISSLRALNLPVIVLDDGSAPEQARLIADVCAGQTGVDLVRSDVNNGKGAAVLEGLRSAAARGFTHALQVDADGQHDLTRCEALLTLARSKPEALVTGKPVFDASVPRIRLVSRWITHVWVSINTLSLRVVDSMCGFRVYPVAATLAAASEAPIALRMAFDTEIMVRMIWRGTTVIEAPVRVVYPENNHSNFRLWQDNLELSSMHARLFFTMLWRQLMSPISRADGEKLRSEHWATLGERGSHAGLWLLAAVFRLFGRRVCLALTLPVVLFFMITGGEQRRASRDYLDRAWKYGLLEEQPGFGLSFRHFRTFASAVLDKLSAWTGGISPDDIDGVEDGEFERVKREGRGVLVLTAHLGNPEVIRAIASLNDRWRVNVLVHTANAARFNALIASYSASSRVRMIQVTEIGPNTAIYLKSAIDNGEWVVMVGDRVPVIGGPRVSWAPFLGCLAPFPQGPHILGSVLECPVYLLFCLRMKGRHKIFFEFFAEKILLPRKSRQAALDMWVARYAQRLETYVRLAPLQWFNFFDFWRPAGMSPPADQVRSTMESGDLVFEK